MDKFIYDKNNGLWYELHGDYYLPCLVVSPEEKQAIGIWGRKRQQYASSMGVYMPAEKETWSPYEYGETMLPEGVESIHPRYAISWRNKWMVNETDIVIAYITHSWGGAAQYVEKARKKEKPIINLAL